MDPILHVSMEFSTFKDANSEEEESTVNIRIPFWTAANSAKAMLNGVDISLPDPGNFLTVTRKWISRDKLALSFPVSLRRENIKDDRPQFQSVQAIMFGPYLLAGMTNGEWNLNIGNATSFYDWMTVAPPNFASQLFALGQYWKISGSNLILSPIPLTSLSTTHPPHVTPTYPTSLSTHSPSPYVTPH